MPFNLEMFIFSSPYGIRTANTYLREIMVVLWCNQMENGAGVEAPFTTFPQICRSYCREAVALRLGPSRAQVICLGPALLYCHLLKRRGVGKCPLLCTFHQSVSIFAQSVVIIMCGSPADLRKDLGTEEMEKDIVIILIDLFK